jgi:hypothetical protein
VLTRNGVLRTTSLASYQPWSFTVTFPGSLKYSQNRELLRDIDTLDRITEETINIGNTNSNLSWITRYQGNANNTSLNSITCISSSSDESNLYLNCSSVTGSTGYLFRKGDFVQPKGNTGGYRYTYQVTSDITLASAAGSSNVRIPVHRDVYSQIPYGVTIGGAGIKWGSNVSFPVKMLQKPSYTILPYDRVTFDSEFQLIEVIKDFST